jgi:cell division protein FtsQ
MIDAPANPAPAPGRSWRSIRQEVRPAMSRQGRRRRFAAWAKISFFVLTFASAGWGIYEVAHAWATDRAALTTAVHSEPVRQVRLVTDGVLPKDWVLATLALPGTASLMALDLPALRDRLLAHGQVRVAVLTREFPDTLVVTLQERTPVARLHAEDGTGTAHILLVAKDGVAYEGQHYGKALLESLPWLDGFTLTRSARGFDPVPGMADVSALLSTAQLEAPHLYRDWQVVSLARLAERDELVVTTADRTEITFSRRRDYLKQIAQLDHIVETAQSLEPAQALQSVNLALEGQVPVRLQSAAPDQATAPVARRAPVFSLQPSQPRSKREF